MKGVGVLPVVFFPVAPEIVAPTVVVVGGAVFLKSFELFLGTLVKGVVLFLSVGGVVDFGDINKGIIQKGIEISGVDPFEFFLGIDVEVGGMVKAQDVGLYGLAGGLVFE